MKRETAALERWLYEEIRTAEMMRDAGGSPHDRTAYEERSQVCATVLRRLKSPLSVPAIQLRDLGSEYRFKLAHGQAGAQEARDRFYEALRVKARALVAAAEAGS